ncbi:hypothetical protein [Nocardia cyriacigeorgica]|uniref:hypothetical protein n=1 Tax=Nocardia cyriacigeorgica TaxID=135487 RepID=UPI001893B8EA|nr:hypothetical protein [Nocardia cyriacigeorgica]MBF6457008.1 hypothetical protein [Nocardia cyriacigeorgica]MBF6478964.1 hypothetical protein [Nocardia cyriacigeorgica]MBF6554331.1 hypothetical protein [Nocardia cyriacigeorgica]
MSTTAHTNHSAHTTHPGPDGHATAHADHAGHDAAALTAHTGHADHGDHAAHGGHGAHGDHAAHTNRAAHGNHAAHADHADHAAHAGHADHSAHGASEFPGGLLITQDGYTLELADTIIQPGEVDFRFRIIGPDGRPVTDYTPIHDKQLHLIVVPRELTGFWHVHPELSADGTWSVRLNLPDAGAYRVFTDISPQALGKTITLGADLAVAGEYAPRPVPEAARKYQVDGYEVELAGDLTTGAGSLLTLTVRRDGAPVTDLQPYLAAFGHLVIIRAGDLAYVHVHPNGAPGDGVTAPGPDISFHTAVPGPGTYRLFLDFEHGDTVRTAAFTVRTPQG